MMDKTNNDKELVPLYSSKNLFQKDVGRLRAGYNIVSKEEVDKWTRHKAVRIATVEEMLSYYDN